MKSLSKRTIARWCDGLATVASASPLRDESFNAARKFVTEFIDIGGHVIIIGSRIGRRGLQALQLLQGFGEDR